MRRKQLAVVLISGLILISGCSSILPGGGSEEIGVGSSAIAVADNTSKSVGATNSISYEVDQTVQVDQLGEVQNVSGSGAVDTGPETLKQESNITARIYQDGKSGYVRPPERTLNVTFAQLSDDEQDQVVQEYRESEDKNLSNLRPDTVIRTVEVGGEWRHVEIPPNPQNATQMEAHAAILSTLADREPSVTYQNGTAILSGTLPAEELRSIYLATHGLPPGPVSGGETSPVEVEYRIDIETLEIQSFSYTLERQENINGQTRNVTGSASFTYSGHNSTDITIPDSVIQQAQDQ